MKIHSNTKSRMTVKSFRAGSRIIRIVAYLLCMLSVVYLEYAEPPAAQAAGQNFSLARPFGQNVDYTTSVAMGDVDGDGNIDIVTGTLDQNAVYLGNKSGIFYNGDIDCSSTTTIRCFGSGDDRTQNVALGDMDGDGDLDIVTSDYSHPSIIYFNDGRGHFHNGSIQCGVTLGVQCFGPTAGQDSIVALGDMDGDGDIDIVLSILGGQNTIYLNDGLGNITADRNFGTGSDNTNGLALGDVNNDGYLDIVVANTNEPSVVYINDRSGNFQSGRGFGSGNDSIYNIVVGDINQDGALDIVAAGINAIFLNDGAGNFTNNRNFAPSSNAATAIALGDIDNDGDLDIVVNGGPDVIYLNDGIAGFSSGWSFGDSFGTTKSIAVGDIDNNGFLDLTFGEYFGQSVVYLNTGAPGTPNAHLPATNFGSASDRAQSIAAGDLNGDGFVDIAVGSLGQQNAIYINDRQGGFATRRIFGPDSSYTESISIGDINADGKLDIVTSNYGQQNVVYLNDGSGDFYSGPVSCAGIANVRCFGPEKNYAHSVTIGDMDGDGDIDLITGNWSDYSVVYLNDGGANFFNGSISCGTEATMRCFGSGADYTSGVAVGDVDGDGDLDIVNGNRGNAVYFNDGFANFHYGPVVCDSTPNVRCFGTSLGLNNRVVLGDVDGDGDLDIGLGNWFQQSAVFLNDGRGNYYRGQLTCGVTPNVRCFGGVADDSQNLAFGDFDGNGSLDIAVGKHDQQIAAIYLNDGTGNFSTEMPLDYNQSAVAFGDVDRDGDLDLMTAFPTASGKVYINGVSSNPHFPNNSPRVAIVRPDQTPDTVSFGSTVILDQSQISITYRLADFESDPVRFIRAFYSPDGGGRWLPAIAATETVTSELTTSPNGVDHTFVWDTLASGFFGQSDNVVFRIEAYSSLKPGKNGVPGPYQYPYAAAQTFPFRVRGSQPRVLDQAGQPMDGAVVYRLPAGQFHGAQAFGFGDGTPFLTNAQGYLQGRGELRLGDRLVAMLPISSTESYTLYYTSAASTATGLDAYPVLSPGVQTLTVSSANPLILLHLSISLEWDARTDPGFLSQLRYDLGRTSELLYDWTDGQAALGDITIYQNREHWDDAHIRIYATNRLRPNANQGGIVSTETTDPGHPDISYAPGQVRIGAVWNRYGEASGTLGEDWPRTLAHELGHYAFYLDDNYLGFDASGRLKQIGTCFGAMSDPYIASNSEFHPTDGWDVECAETLANRTTGRSDWATITTFYDHPGLNFSLHEPAVYDANPGPSVLPLAVTRITEAPVAAPSDALGAPVFTVTDINGGHVMLSKGARAVLYPREAYLHSRTGERLVDLGSPVLDQVVARGARPGDRLCVYDLNTSRQRCADVSATSDQIALIAPGGWQPDVLITPVTSTTLTITVNQVGASRQLHARLYPSDAPATGEISLAPTPNGYTGTFQLASPVLAGHVRVWDTLDDAEPETVVDYALGGNPGYVRSRNAPRGSPGYVRSRNAPAVSTDGQVILYTDNVAFAPGEFYTVQATSAASAPPWATVIGQAYRLTASPNAPDLRGAVLDIGYAGSDVPPGEEPWIKIYHLEGAQWTPLPTTLDQDHNEASTRVVGPGLYALMSSVEIGLSGPGWNNIAYPVLGMAPLPDALQSIDGAYTTIYGYSASDTADPWKVYDTTAPAWVNDLHELHFGQGYWIQATQAITLYLHGSQPNSAAVRAAIAGLQSPPATYYGVVGSASAFTPAVDVPVIAQVNNVICGQSKTQRVGTQIVYSINVLADGPGGAAGCGAAGRFVQFQIGGRTVLSNVPWDNQRLHVLNFGQQRIYLPLLHR